ncbi:MAG: hypothetical protein KAI43_04540 [Candidatus Aureabacteria bacterium]|nr:hypothetical protein [Candidatus Auribacterota bacterium]
MTKDTFTKKIIFYDSVGFGIVIFFIWLNEIFDVPHLIFGNGPTPINITESIVETVIVFILFLLVITFTKHLLKRIKYLEGFLRVCSFCKKINIEDKWISIENYFRDSSEVEFTHSFCPECADKHYGIILNNED